jgi:hypothetical protein
MGMSVNGGRTSYRVTHDFRAAGVVSDATCESLRQLGLDDTPIQAGHFVAAYPAKGGLVRFTLSGTRCTFCVEESVFMNCTQECEKPADRGTTWP